jgi:hypothetical protein
MIGHANDNSLAAKIGWISDVVALTSGAVDDGENI